MNRFKELFLHADLLAAFAVLGIIMLMIIPIPAFFIDIFLTISIGISLLVLLTSLFISKPLEFYVFPTVLLLVTLFRLSMNVATTRIILLHGHEGREAAGDLIAAFGEYAVGGNVIVGIVVFTILVVINFIVITKGAGRVSEVAARFTLDAMPGKQMAIDADLNAGMINEQEARRRRKLIADEADFFGAMDGSSKFVRGDAIAGIIITIVNISGGLGIGVLQQNLEFMTAVELYTIFTIGDGLVSQIPALIISVASGIVVTRAGSESSFGKEVTKQVFFKKNVMTTLSGMLAGMAFIGLFTGALPAIPFLIMSAVTGIWVYFLNKIEKAELEKGQSVVETNKDASATRESLEKLLPIDTLRLDVGVGLINIVDPDQNGELLGRIRAIRKQFAEELGIIVPSIQVQDNLELRQGSYNLYLKGVLVASGELHVDHILAMDPGDVSQKIEGIDALEPVFGLPAVWIPELRREEATVRGYTVVDNATVIATHLTEVIRNNADQLIGRQETSSLLDLVKQNHAKVIEELVPSQIPLGTVVKVLQNLLKEQVSVRDMLTVLETMADFATKIKDPDVLTEYVRAALSRSILDKYKTPTGEIPILTLNQEIEDHFIQSLRNNDQDKSTQMMPDQAFVKRLREGLSNIIEKLTTDNVQTILLVAPDVRRHVKKLVDRYMPNVVVISHSELYQGIKIKHLGMIG